MTFGRNNRFKLSTLLHLATLLLFSVVAIQYMRFYVIDEFTHPGSPHDLRKIAVIVLEHRFDGYPQNRLARFPASHFRCDDMGHCSGKIGEHLFDIDIAFDSFPRYTCSGSYNGTVIECRGLINNDDFTMPIVDIELAQLGLTETEVQRLDRIARFAPYHGMEQLWIVIGILYVCLFLWRLIKRPKNHRTPAASHQLTRL